MGEFGLIWMALLHVGFYDSLQAGVSMGFFYNCYILVYYPVVSDKMATQGRKIIKDYLW